MIVFSNFLSKIRVVLDRNWPKMTIVHSLKILNFDRTPTFYMRRYGTHFQRCCNLGSSSNSSVCRQNRSIKNITSYLKKTRILKIRQECYLKGFAVCNKFDEFFEPIKSLLTLPLYNFEYKYGAHTLLVDLWYLFGTIKM